MAESLSDELTESIGTVNSLLEQVAHKLAHMSDVDGDVFHQGLTIETALLQINNTLKDPRFKETANLHDLVVIGERIQSVSDRATKFLRDNTHG